jgi:hypothetical protein
MLPTDDNGIDSCQKMQLDEYKFMETRLFGEVLKSCQSYTNKISIISILGILELVKQEIKDLDKQTQQFIKDND